MEILKVNHINKSLSKRLIIKDISFEIHKQEIVGFIGPNGAGKTTTLKLITNLIIPDQGNISICGYDVNKERVKALENIAAIIENPGLYPYLTGMDHLNFIAKSRSKTKKQLQEVIDFINIKDFIHLKTSKYSLGMKQRLGLGICLLADPKLLILDEPTNGLDPTGIIELRGLLRKLRDEKQMTILFSSHNLSEIEKLCDRIIFIRNGEIINIEKEENTKIIYQIKVDDIQNCSEILNENDYIFNIENQFMYIKLIDEECLDGLLSLLIANKIKILSIQKVQAQTEDIYARAYTNE